MGTLAFAVAFLALPVATFLLVRSLTWTVAAVTGASAVAGAVVTYAMDQGYRWTLVGLQSVLAVTLVIVLVAAFVTGRHRAGWSTIPFRRQLTSTLLPVAVGFVMIAVSRLLAAPHAGAFTAVGFLVKRQSAEDNAKWLDFAGQVVTGHEVVQGVPMGGALQLFMVLVMTILSAASILLLGGINEVFVAANGVVYSEFALAALAPFALAPIAEARVRLRSGSAERGFIPAPLVWAGMLVLVTASLAASGLGHLTLQLVMIAVALWISVFLVGSKAPHAYALSSLAIVSSAVVWFPLTPVSVLVLVAGALALLVRIVRTRPLRSAPWVMAAVWLAMVVMTWTSFTDTLRYMSDMGSTSAMGSGGAGGGVHAGVFAVLPSLELLTSQGGTEKVAPTLAVLVLLASVLAAMFLARRRAHDSRLARVIAFAPVILIGGYALLLTLVGTWWAGTGPAYGAIKTTFMASATVLAVVTPLALMEIDRKRSGVTLVRVAAIVGLFYVLSIDSLMPRAFTYLSPQQWPSVAEEEKGYWWPAEVKTQEEQTIASLPIGCAYRPPGSEPPTALPNGQTPYSCTRLLSGLSGADTTGQPLVDWLRREWLNNEAAWYNEYPGLLLLPDDVRAKKLILMDDQNNVIGLESIQYFMDRYKPQWAQEGASG